MATGGIRQERSREACKGRGQAAWASATRPVSPEAAQRPAGGGSQQAKPGKTVGRTPTSILNSRELKRRGNEAPADTPTGGKSCEHFESARRPVDAPRTLRRVAVFSRWRNYQHGANFAG